MEELGKPNSLDINVEVTRQEIGEIKRKLAVKKSRSKVQPDHNELLDKLKSLEDDLTVDEPRAKGASTERDAGRSLIDGLIALERTGSFPERYSKRIEDLANEQAQWERLARSAHKEIVKPRLKRAASWREYSEIRKRYPAPSWRITGLRWASVVGRLTRGLSRMSRYK